MEQNSQVFAKETHDIGSTPTGSPLIVAIDTETHLITDTDAAPQVVCLAWAFRRPGPKAFRHLKSGLLAKVARSHSGFIQCWLKFHLTLAIQGQIKLIGHNLAYDAACICRTWPSLEELVFEAYEKDGLTCTKVREQLLDISEGCFRTAVNDEGNKTKTGYGLAELAQKNLGKTLVKDESTWRLRFAELENKPREDWPEEAVDYAIGDAVTTLDLYEAQETRGYNIGYTIPTQHLDARADFALRKMSVHGIKVDQAQVQERLAEARSEIKRLVEELKSSNLITVKKIGEQCTIWNDVEADRIEVKKNLSVMRVEVEKRHPQPIPYTEKGAISTTKEVLTACMWPPFDTLLEYKALERQISTYWNRIYGVSEVHASFVGVGAASGRTTCHDPNLQFQPRKPGVRECFIPRPGHVFISCDFDSQEMRTMAQSCIDLLGHSRLAERYQEDARFDPHMEFAKQLADGDESADLKHLRQQAKVCNFGYPGGLGDATLVDFAKSWGVDLTETRAKELRVAWLTAWPEMREYFRHVANLVGASIGVVEIPQSGFRRSGVHYTSGCNTYFQSLAAHASKQALWDVAVKCYCDEGSYLYRSRPVIFLHDEIILETPDFVADHAAWELEDTMIAAMNRWTPDVPASAQAKIMKERWSK